MSALDEFRDEITELRGKIRDLYRDGKRLSDEMDEVVIELGKIFEQIERAKDDGASSTVESRT